MNSLHRTRLLRAALLLLLGLLLILPGPRSTAARQQTKTETQILDLSLLVAPDLPCTWPAGFPLFQINSYRRIGRLSDYNCDILPIDGNTGTQLDFPPHSIPLPDSKLPNAGPAGRVFSDKVLAWQFA